MKVTRERCDYADKYQAKREPTCGCAICDVKWKAAVLLDSLIGLVEERRSELRDYYNEKEQQKLQCMVSDVVAGTDSAIDLINFLVYVPSGEYDGDRRHYNDLLLTKRKLMTEGN